MAIPAPEWGLEQDRLAQQHGVKFDDQPAARALLVEVGFSEDELPRLWLGAEMLSLRDHRLQRLIYRCLKQS